MSDDKRIMIFAPVHQREWILPLYLRNLYNLDYEKKKIRILWIVNNCSDKSNLFLEIFKKNYGHEYESVDIQIWDNPKIGLDARNVKQRKEFTYQWLTDLRNRGVSECIKQGCDYLFSCDSDILVEKNSLKNLLSFDKDYISNLLYNGYQVFPDKYWTTPNVLRKQDATYIHVNNYHTKNKRGIIACDFSGASFLCSKKALPYLNFDYNILGEDLPACQSLQKAGFDLFCSCDDYVQHVMSEKWLEQFKDFGIE